MLCSTAHAFYEHQLTATSLALLKRLGKMFAKQDVSLYSADLKGPKQLLILCKYIVNSSQLGIKVFVNLFSWDLLKEKIYYFVRLTSWLLDRGRPWQKELWLRGFEDI